MYTFRIKFKGSGEEHFECVTTHPFELANILEHSTATVKFSVSDGYKQIMPEDIGYGKFKKWSEKLFSRHD